MTTENLRARPLDVTKPTAARLYDYYLGGDDHDDVDKVFAERMFRINPYLDVSTHHNREFLQRAVRYMAAECDVEQFLDIGSGIPTVGNTHHVVGEVVSGARVVYVDNDVEAVNQSYDLLDRENAFNVTVIEEDLRNPDAILDHPDTRRVLDFDAPVGLLMIAVWPFISDDEGPHELMARCRDRLSAGSYVAISHPSLEGLSDEVKEMYAAVADSYDETADPVTTRGREQFSAFFDGLTVVDPGVVYAADWRPVEPVDAGDPVRPHILAAVARKP